MKITTPFPRITNDNLIPGRTRAGEDDRHTVFLRFFQDDFPSQILTHVWRPLWVTSQAPTASQPTIYNSLCRAHQRLPTEGKIFSTYCTVRQSNNPSEGYITPFVPKGEGICFPPPPRIKGKANLKITLLVKTPMHAQILGMWTLRCWA